MKTAEAKLRSNYLETGDNLLKLSPVFYSASSIPYTKILSLLKNIECSLVFYKKSNYNFIRRWTKQSVACRFLNRREAMLYVIRTSLFILYIHTFY